MLTATLTIHLLSPSDSISCGAEHTFREALFGPLPAGLIGILVKKITLQDKVNCQLVHTTYGLIRALLETQKCMFNWCCLFSLCILSRYTLSMWSEDTGKDTGKINSDLLWSCSGQYFVERVDCWPSESLWIPPLVPEKRENEEKL